MKLATGISVLLNLVLGVGLVAVATHRQTSTPQGNGFAVATKRLPRPNRLREPAPKPDAPSPVIVAVDEAFQWSQLESADYRVYLAKLRAIDCPEVTIRDLITADVNAAFAPRVRDLVDPVSAQFWVLIAHPKEFEKMIEAKHDQLRVLEAERDAVLADLFSDPDSDALASRDQADPARREYWNQLADFLPERERQKFVQANAALEHAWAEFLKTPQLTGAQQQARRRELEAAREADFATWLTPEQIAELRLRQSEAASLRHRIVGIDLSEDEIRAAARLELARQPVGTNRNFALIQAQENAFRDQFGPERYAELQRSTDARFASLYRVTQRLELPVEVAEQAYDIRKQAEAAVKRIKTDASLEAAAREPLLQAIRAETEQSLTTTLGGRGFSAYQNLDAGWLQQMTAK